MSIKLLKFTLFSLLLTLLNSSCKQGVQGGKVDNSFQGVAEISVLSPNSVKLVWNKDSKYLTYKIYQKGLSTELGTSSFSEFVLNNLVSDSDYDFSVSGLAADDNGEEDFQQNFIRIKTFADFQGLQSSGVSVVSADRVNVRWAVNGYGVNYKVQFKRPFETIWADAKIVTSQTDSLEFEEAVTGLMGGTSYCFRVTAEYIDGTSQPSESNHPVNCVTTTTDLTNLPSVFVGSSTPGNFPWFNAIGGNPTYNIDIFDESMPTVPIASLNNGTGVFRSSFPIDSGTSDLYAIIRDTSNGVQARVDMSYYGGTELNTRAFTDTGQKGAVHPPLVNGGKGLQNLGSKIVSGDFNCDGLEDVAVGAPTASPVTSSSLVYATGAVVIYYGYDPPFDNETATNPPPYLNTSGTPSVGSVFPDPHLIHYPLGTNDQLGTKLVVGNFNGDCFYRDGSSPANGLCATLYETHKSSEENIDKIKSCDDLAIAGSAVSSTVFAVFGDPLQGLVSGAGGTNYGLDEYTCNAGSSSCRSVKLSANSDNGVSYLGKSMATGDFNNDGFDDLALASNYTDSGVSKNRIYVLRGTDQGLTPIGDSGNRSFASIDTNVGAVFSDSVQADDFGFAMAPFYNSRLCQAGASFEYRRLGPTENHGYDFSKCDDLVIGAPSRASGRGSIYSCKASLPAKNSVTDDEKITSWSCLEHYPKDINDEGDNAGYGYSLLGVRNQNGHPLKKENFRPELSEPLPNITGALFVGAPRRLMGGQDNAGSVYGYYVLPSGVDHATGGIQGIFGNASGEHVTSALNSLPCNARNTSCSHQQITSSPPQSGAQFGAALSSITSVDGSLGMPYLAVSSPYRNVSDSTGNQTITNSGVIYLYNPDISLFGPDDGVTVSRTQVGSFTTNCLVDCTWLSGGVSPFGPSVIYPQDLTANSYFGLGGAVGGNFDGDAQNFGDLLSSAPNYGDPVEDNGGLFGFHAEGGSFSSVENGTDISVTLNISNELNYRFENAKIIGDVNGDGYSDVVSKIEIGSKVSSIIYYGSSNGLITSTEPSENAIGLNPRILFNSFDNQMGKRFYKIGSVNCDSFDDILLIGSRGSYIYYGSSTGIIAGVEPSPSPVGKNPLNFARQVSNSSYDFLAITTSSFNLNSPESLYDTSNQGVGYGDFNGDECNDVAIGITSNADFSGVGVASVGDLNFGSEQPNYSTANRGRVVILYGGDNGLQINDAEGVLHLSKTGNVVGNIVAGQPCDIDSNCNVQMIAGPGLSIAGYIEASDDFGADVVGITSFGESNGEIFDELAISSPSEDNDNGAVYVFQGSSFGLNVSYHQQLLPDLDSGAGDTTNFSGERFGQHLAFLGDVNGDNNPDLAISSPGALSNVKGHVYLFYSGSIGADFGFVGESLLKQANFWDPAQSPLGVNQPFASNNPTDIKPQILSPINVGATDNFARGLASADDFNRDGFKDLLVNIAMGDYLQEVNLADSGFTIMYFGSELGLQISNEETLTPRCIYASGPIECDPFQIYLPSRLTQERSYLSNNAVGDVDGDSLIDIIMGARGRNHPTGQASATGVFYIMY